ncbi:MAG: response regulator [Chloroflexi bacterium]|nr:response regulator [Chloroflexota bacterium]
MAAMDERDLEIAGLRERLSLLSEASLRINDSLDFDRVLQGVLESARSLTGARYGVMVLFDDGLQIQDFMASGMSLEEAGMLWNVADGLRFFEHIGGLSGQVRHPDFHRYARELDLPELNFPAEVHLPLAVLFAPITYRGRPSGVIYLGDTVDGREFSPEDEETLLMFTSQAALVIANARYHRDERRARADLEALVDTAPVGVVVFDARTGVPVSINLETRRVGREFFSESLSVEEILQLLTVRRADGSVMSMRELPMAVALSSGETVRAEEVELSIPDGGSMTAIVNATPIHGEGGEIESFVVTMQDMTPLQDLERLRAEFLGMVSHELRTPLTSIRGSANTLLDEGAMLDPVEMRQFHRIIFEQSERMRGLISDLLDVARIETGSLSVTPAPVEVSALMEEVKGIFLAVGSGNNIRIDLPADLPMVLADRRRVVQVLNNLLSNAVRESPEPSVIRVNAAFQGGYVAVSVSDRGRGIPANLLPRLFRKFSRSADDEQTDTGLGLAICKGIVEAHGGRIWAESDGPDTGARFTFTLPVAEGASTGRADGAGGSAVRAPLVGVSGEAPRVLVVDDDPQTLRYVRDVLSRAGYVSSVAADPREVPRLVEEVAPHLVLLDLMLPGSNGIELMASVQELAAVPVVFLSAYGQDEVIVRAFQAGAADYVVKPFSPSELLARIQAALRRGESTAPAEAPRDPYVFGDLVIDYSRRDVSLRGEPVYLTTTEYRLLAELSAHAGRVMTHDQLLQRVWGSDGANNAGLLRSVVKRLRQKLGDPAAEPIYLFTRRGVGYWMAAAVVD